jgi:hypothetical protein
MSNPTSRPVSYRKLPRLSRESLSEQPSAGVYEMDSKMISCSNGHVCPKVRAHLRGRKYGIIEILLPTKRSFISLISLISQFGLFQLFPFILYRIVLLYSHRSCRFIFFSLLDIVILIVLSKNYLAQADYGS